MLKKNTMQEIQDLKLRGYTQTEIHDYFVDQGVKPPSRPTIAKYFKMDVVPDNPGEKLAKDRSSTLSHSARQSSRSLSPTTAMMITVYPLSMIFSRKNYKKTEIMTARL